MVDGIKASCYIALQEDDSPEFYPIAFSHHFLSHLATSPIRALCLGVSSKFCADHAMDTNSGYSWYVKIWFSMIKWFGKQSSVLIQTVLFTAFLIIFGVFLAFETVFGASLAPIFMALSIASGLVMTSRYTVGASTCSGIEKNKK